MQSLQFGYKRLFSELTVCFFMIHWIAWSFLTVNWHRRPFLLLVNELCYQINGMLVHVCRETICFISRKMQSKYCEPHAAWVFECIISMMHNHKEYFYMFCKILGSDFLVPSQEFIPFFFCFDSLLGFISCTRSGLNSTSQGFIVHCNLRFGNISLYSQGFNRCNAQMT